MSRIDYKKQFRQPPGNAIAQKNPHANLKQLKSGSLFPGHNSQRRFLGTLGKPMRK